MQWYVIYGQVDELHLEMNKVLTFKVCNKVLTFKVCNKYSVFKS